MRILKKKPFIGLICSIFIILVFSRSRKRTQDGVRESKPEKVIFERDNEEESFPTDAKNFSFAKSGFLDSLYSSVRSDGPIRVIACDSWFMSHIQKSDKVQTKSRRPL